MVESIHDVCEQWTGVRPIGCPWASLRDPLVIRVIRALGVDDLNWSEPEPSNRFVEAVKAYKGYAMTVGNKRREQERESRRTAGDGGEVIRG